MLLTLQNYIFLTSVTNWCTGAANICERTSFERRAVAYALDCNSGTVSSSKAASAN